MAANPSIQLGTDGNWAIKEDNLLAYKKDGTRFFNKEFDFTRGSLATFVDKDGLIKVSGVTDTELVTNGNFDNNSDWSNFGTPITSEQSTDKAYLGSYSWYIVASAFRQGIFSPNNFSLVSGKTYRASLWIYALDGAEILSGVTNSDASVFTSRTVAQGQWTNIVYYFTATATSASYISILSSSSTLEFYVDNVSVKEIQTDVPRIDFTDDTTGHLLLEPQSTNLLPYSEDFTQWFQPNANVVLTSNKAPNGTTSSVYNLTGTSANLYYSGTINVEHTISFYIKSNNQGKNRFKLRLGNNTSVEYIATNKWVRYEFTSTPTTSVFGITTTSSPNNEFDLLIWGAQSEASSYATSYIPTYGSTVTRNAEVCNNSGSAQDFNSEEGVLYAEIAALADDGTFRLISLDGGDNTNVVKFGYRTTSNAIYYEVRSGNVSQAFQIYTTTDVKQFHKVAVLYQQNNFKLFINGVNVLSDTSGITPVGLNNISFDVNNAAPFYGKTKNLKVFKRAMSDGELYLLTVTQYQSYQEMATALNYTL